MSAESVSENELVKIARSYPRPAMAVVPILQRLQRSGGVKDAHFETVARVCEVETSTLRSFAELYPDLTVEPSPPGPALCVGLCCLLHGTGAIRERLQESPEFLGYTAPIQLVHCLGHCYAAPVAVDGSGRLCRLAIEE